MPTMSSRLSCLLACLILLGWSPATAADVVYSKEYERCLEASGGVTFSMIECMTTELALWDARLNANYKKLMKTLSPKQQKTMILAETSWLKFRENNCAWDPDYGTAARLEANSCILRMTAERALELLSRIRPE